MVHIFCIRGFVALYWTCGSVFLTSALFFQLMDISEKLWQVYNRLDPVSLDSLLAEVPLTSIGFCGINMFMFIEPLILLGGLVISLNSL